MAISRIQYKRGTDVDTTVSLTLDSTPTNGNLLVAVIGTTKKNSSATVDSINQTGVTWTQQEANSDNISIYYNNVEIWVGVVTSGASKDIVVNLSDTVPRGGVVNVCEYSGLLTSGFLDKTASNEGISNASDTGTTATTSQNDELWVGGIDVLNATQSSPTNGFTLLDGAKYGTTSVAYLEKIVSSTGTANSGTALYTSTLWIGVIATFKASAPPPTGEPVSSSIVALMRVEGMLATKIPRKLPKIPDFRLKMPKLNLTRMLIRE